MKIVDFHGGLEVWRFGGLDGAAPELFGLTSLNFRNDLP